MENNNQVKCGNCWWFLRSPTLPKGKGHCLTYGFIMKEDDVICCDYDWGKRC